jgi:hypothetical protein
MKKKILIASLFATLMLLIPMTSAVDLNSDVNDEITDNSDKIVASDDYAEIITWISGSGHPDIIERFGPFLYEVSITRCGNYGGPNLFGLRSSNGSVETYHERDIAQVYIPRFRGFMLEPMMIMGIAFGDIEWS